MKMYDVTEHAIQRAVERLGISKEHARNHLINIMQSAYYHGSTPYAKGVRKLYDHVKSKTRIVVSDDNSTIITVYKFPEIYEATTEFPKFVQEKVAKVVQRELKRFESTERKVERRNTLYKAELEVEIAELNLRLLRARSESKKMALKARIQAIQLRIDELDNEIIEVKRKKSIIAKGVAAYV